MIADPRIDAGHNRLVELASHHRLPTISSDPAFAAAGGVMSYGPNSSDQQRRTAYFIDKLLKGARAADLPVERPTSFDLVINLAAVPGIKRFVQELRGRGWVEGWNLAIEWREALGRPDRERPLATELVRLGVEVIVATNSGLVEVARTASKTIPIVTIGSTARAGGAPRTRGGPA